MRTLPLSGLSRPAASRSVVVLPAPVGPRSTTNSPSPTRRLKSRMACVCPNDFETPWRMSSAMGHPLVQGRPEHAARCPLEEGELLRTELQTRGLARPHPHLRRDTGLDERALRSGEGDDLVGAEVLRLYYRRAQRRAGREPHVLGARSEHEVGLYGALARLGDLDGRLARLHGPVAREQPPAERNEVH